MSPDVIHLLIHGGGPVRCCSTLFPSMQQGLHAVLSACGRAHASSPSPDHPPRIGAWISPETMSGKVSQLGIRVSRISVTAATAQAMRSRIQIQIGGPTDANELDARIMAGSRGVLLGDVAPREMEGGKNPLAFPGNVVHDVVYRISTQRCRISEKLVEGKRS